MERISNNYQDAPSKPYIRTFAIVLAIFGVLIFLARAKASLNMFEFGDETEKLVAAQMIKAGMRLYHDIFAHHGPVAYIISHAYVNLVDPTNFSHIRWFMVGLALLASLSIYTSPIFKNTTSRLIATGAFLVLLSSIWAVQGIHMMLYHQIGGFLFIIPITQVFLPLLYGHKPTAFGFASAGFSCAIICFTAYAFGPSVILISISSIILIITNRHYTEIFKQIIPVFWGALFATSIVAIWIALNADFEGYFIYHFYFNQAVYSKFIEFNLGAIKNLFFIDFSRPAIVHTFILFGLIASLFFLAKTEKPQIFKKNNKPTAFSVVLFFLSLIMLNPRGSTGFHDAGLDVAGLAVFSVLGSYYIDEINGKLPTKKIALIILGILCTILLFELASRKAISSPYGVRKSDFKSYSNTRNATADYGLITELVENDKDLLALIFRPSIYIDTGKSPTSGHYYYLPWQAAYNKNPVDGYKIDICKDLELHRPSVIWFDNWKVWERYSIQDYEPCVMEIINSSYRAITKGSYFYIKSDRLMQDHAALNVDEGKISATRPLDESAPIALKIFSPKNDDNGALKRIGIKFETHTRDNPGDAQLELSASDGKVFRQNFPLSELKNNHYKYFDVPNDIGANFASGKILSGSGSGISTLEIQSTDGNSLTCINYIYSDNKIAVTPGCPQ